MVDKQDWMTEPFNSVIKADGCECAGMQENWSWRWRDTDCRNVNAFICKSPAAE